MSAEAINWQIDKSSYPHDLSDGELDDCIDRAMGRDDEASLEILGELVDELNRRGELEEDRLHHTQGPSLFQ